MHVCQLNTLLEENKWLKEIDPSVVRIIFDSVLNQQNALEICHEMFISKMEEEIDQIQIAKEKGNNSSNAKKQMAMGEKESTAPKSSAGKAETTLEELLQGLVNENKLSREDKESFFKYLGTTAKLEDLRQFPEDILIEIASNSISSIVSQIHVLSKITNADFDESEMDNGQEGEKQKEEGIPVTFHPRKVKKRLSNKAKEDEEKKERIENDRIRELIKLEESDIEKAIENSIEKDSNLGSTSTSESSTSTLSISQGPPSNQRKDIIIFFQELFPKLDKEILDILLKDNDYDVFKALEVVIGIESEKEEEEMFEEFENVEDLQIHDNDEKKNEKDVVDEIVEYSNTPPSQINISNINNEEDEKKFEQELEEEDGYSSNDGVDETTLALSILVDMFPEKRMKILKKALSRNDNNVEESINDILEGNTRQITPKQLKEKKERKERNQPNNNKPEIKKQPPPKKIQQTQKEAPSLPLPMTKTHIYELYGINKEKDPFLPTNFSQSKIPKRHVYVPKEGSKKIQTVEPEPEPELPKKSLNKNYTYVPPSNWTLAKKLQFQSLINHFPDMDHTVLETVFIYCEFHVETTKHKLEEIMVKEPHKIEYEEIPESRSPKATYRNHDFNNNSNNASQSDSNKVKLRNECFHQAAKAFVNNDNAKAKIFSDLGRKMNSDIYNDRQAELRDRLVSKVETTFSRDFPDVPKIDLHGFYVKNALEILDKLLNYYEGKCPNGVNVVTGVGNHSIGPARIKPAVQAYLVDNGFRFKVNRNNPGSLLVFP